MSLQDKEGESPLHEALRYHTLTQLREINEANDIQTVCYFDIMIKNNYLVGENFFSP